MAWHYPGDFGVPLGADPALAGEPVSRVSVERQWVVAVVARGLYHFSFRKRSAVFSYAPAIKLRKLSSGSEIQNVRDRRVGRILRRPRQVRYQAALRPAV